MTINEAKKIVDDFYDLASPSETDVFMFTEACDFLIQETKDPAVMMDLGGYYYEIKQFDLALKYYEMAASYDHPYADECLGYVWYYGRTGKVDYEKAFYHFSKCMERGHLVATYKIADMYKNGYFVQKDYEKYKEIIKGLYPLLAGWSGRRLNEPIPEVYTRMAKILTEEGRYDEAIDLYFSAKEFLIQRINYNPFFGNLTIMKWLEKDLYSVLEFDEEDFDLYDCYYLFRAPCKISFLYRNKKQTVEAAKEEGGMAICFNGKWFRNVDDFFAGAKIGDKLLTSIFNDLYGYEIEARNRQAEAATDDMGEEL